MNSTRRLLLLFIFQWSIKYSHFRLASHAVIFIGVFCTLIIGFPWGSPPGNPRKHTGNGIFLTGFLGGGVGTLVWKRTPAIGQRYFLLKIPDDQLVAICIPCLESVARLILPLYKARDVLWIRRERWANSILSDFVVSEHSFFGCCVKISARRAKKLERYICYYCTMKVFRHLSPWGGGFGVNPRGWTPGKANDKCIISPPPPKNDCLGEYTSVLYWQKQIFSAGDSKSSFCGNRSLLLM